jgi:hypothetical protein
LNPLAERTCVSQVSEPQLWGVMFWFTLAMDMYFIVGEKNIN